jgi:predicted AAA+ superfamily ATPase
MRPMSLFESNESSGEVSLKAIFEQDYNIGSISNLEIEEIAKSIVRGGWPASVTSKSESSVKRAQDYVDSIVQFDVSRIDGIEKNPNKMFALLRSLSHNISTEANYTVLIKDMECTSKIICCGGIRGI